MTQNRLLDVAIRVFGENGLEGASTRQIAEAAGTAMSAITYHYGGKEQLYMAAADRIAETIAELMEAVIYTQAETAAMDADEARAAIHCMMSRLAERMLNNGNSEYSQFILREQLNPTEAFDRIYTRLMGGMLETLTRLIVTVTGVTQGRAAMTTIAFIGQALAPRYMQTSMLRILKQKKLSAEMIDGYRLQLTLHIDAILDRMTAQQKDVS